jgi:hypothetical protein
MHGWMMHSKITQQSILWLKKLPITEVNFNLHPLTESRRQTHLSDVYQDMKRTKGGVLGQFHAAYHHLPCFQIDWDEV